MKDKTTNGSKRRKKYIVLIIVLLLSFFIIKFPLVYAFDEYMIWNGEGVEDDGWKELIYAGSFIDRMSVKPVMDKAEEAFSSFPQTREEAYEQFGRLGGYCIYGKGDKVAYEEHSLKLISANVDKDRGYMWVHYAQAGYSADNKLVCGSWDVNSRWTIERNSSGEWEVTGIHEHP